jgi:hypothetical protein
MERQCPECGLYVPSKITKCECGYDFNLGQLINIEQNAGAQPAVSPRRSGETVLYAFFVQATEYSDMLRFGRKVVFINSLDDWKDKIREHTQCPGMEVVIIPSEEWDPPSIRSFSVSDLRNVFPQVRAQIQRAMSKMGLPDSSSQQLTAEGGVVGSPLSGKIFFVRKVTF